MSEHRETSGTRMQPRWRSRANQARFCVLLALLLPGCQTEPGQAVAKFWDRAWGPANEGRPAPPNANAPFPNLGTVPPRPEIPDMAARDALANRLVQQGKTIAYGTIGGAGDHGQRISLGRHRFLVTNPREMLRERVLRHPPQCEGLAAAADGDRHLAQFRRRQNEGHA